MMKTGRLCSFLKSDRGATAVEYALLVVGVAAAIISAVYALGEDVDALYPRISAYLTGR